MAITTDERLPDESLFAQYRELLAGNETDILLQHDHAENAETVDVILVPRWGDNLWILI